MEYNKLPADPSALILGIIAIIISLAGCCCGVFAIIPVILSIIGLVIANKSLQQYNTSPELYDPNSKSNVATAKVLNIISLVISSLITLGYIAYFMVYGVFISELFKQAYEARNQTDTYDYEWDTDSIYSDDDQYYELESDTIRIDSMSVEEFIKKEPNKTDSLN